MDPVVVSIIAFACTFGGVLIGMGLRANLPKGHLDSDSKDTIKMGVGLIATMTALVLGLVTASAKSSFDSVDSAVKQAAMQFLTLDRLLARYGPETSEIRNGLKNVLGVRIEQISPRGSPGSSAAFGQLRRGRNLLGRGSPTRSAAFNPEAISSDPSSRARRI
jgi:hypothetical protein